MECHFNIVLVEPEIPQNTGSIGRLCLATGSTLHLVEPMAFDISDRALKRAGLDYWQYLSVKTHPSIEAFMDTLTETDDFVFFSKKAGITHFEYSYKKGTYMIFGKETAGLPDWLVNKYPTRLLRIPMQDARVRSLNLATATGIALYEGIRQLSH
jgi:tRNA (cytidine/uridine-2'-O-)-methyltransferase